jgi:hypothetical protein
MFHFNPVNSNSFYLCFYYDWKFARGHPQNVVDRIAFPLGKREQSGKQLGGAPHEIGFWIS